MVNKNNKKVKLLYITPVADLLAGILGRRPPPKAEWL